MSNKVFRGNLLHVRKQIKDLIDSIVRNIDGGSASSVYLSSQQIDGGSA